MAETDISKIARQAADMLLAEASTLESAEVETNAELIAYLLGTDSEDRAKRVSMDILGKAIKTVEFKDIFSVRETGYYVVTHNGSHLGLLLFRYFGGYDRHVLVTTATESQLNMNLTKGFDLDKMNLYRSNSMKRWEQLGGEGMLRRVAWSGERVSGVNVNKVSYQEVDAVVLYTSNEGTDYFVGRKGSGYCNNWLGSENYQTGVESDALLRKDVLYVSDKEILVSSEDQKHALHVTDGKRGMMRRVVWSGERVQSPHVIQGSTATYEQIDLAMFSNGTMYFVAKQGTSYYENWTGRDNYQLVTKKPIGSEVKLHADVLYVSDKEVLVSSEDGSYGVSLTRSVWTFRKLMGLTTSSTETEVAEALGVETTVEELLEALKRYTFIDEEYDESGAPIQHYSCLVDFFDNDGVFRIIVEKAGSRRVITFDEKKGTNHIESIEDFVYKKEPTTETVVYTSTPRKDTASVLHTTKGSYPILFRFTICITDASSPLTLTFNIIPGDKSAINGFAYCSGLRNMYKLSVSGMFNNANGLTSVNISLTTTNGGTVIMDSLVSELKFMKGGAA